MTSLGAGGAAEGQLMSPRGGRGRGALPLPPLDSSPVPGGRGVRGGRFGEAGAVEVSTPAVGTTSMLMQMKRSVILSDIMAVSGVILGGTGCMIYVIDSYSHVAVSPVLLQGGTRRQHWTDVSYNESSIQHELREVEQEVKVCRTEPLFRSHCSRSLSPGSPCDHFFPFCFQPFHSLPAGPDIECPNSFYCLAWHRSGPLLVASRPSTLRFRSPP